MRRWRATKLIGRFSATATMAAMTIHTAAWASWPKVIHSRAIAAVPARTPTSDAAVGTTWRRLPTTRTTHVSASGAAGGSARSLVDHAITSVAPATTTIAPPIPAMDVPTPMDTTHTDAGIARSRSTTRARTTWARIPSSTAATNMATPPAGSVAAAASTTGVSPTTAPTVGTASQTPAHIPSTTAPGMPAIAAIAVTTRLIAAAKASECRRTRPLRAVTPDSTRRTSWRSSRCQRAMSPLVIGPTPDWKNAARMTATSSCSAWLPTPWAESRPVGRRANTPSRPSRARTASATRAGMVPLRRFSSRPVSSSAMRSDWPDRSRHSTAATATMTRQVINAVTATAAARPILPASRRRSGSVTNASVAASSTSPRVFSSRTTRRTTTTMASTRSPSRRVSPAALRRIAGVSLAVVSATSADWTVSSCGPTHAPQDMLRRTHRNALLAACATIVSSSTPEWTSSIGP